MIPDTDKRKRLEIRQSLPHLMLHSPKQENERTFSKSLPNGGLVKVQSDYDWKSARSNLDDELSTSRSTSTGLNLGMHFGRPKPRSRSSLQLQESDQNIRLSCLFWYGLSHFDQGGGDPDESRGWNSNRNFLSAVCFPKEEEEDVDAGCCQRSFVKQMKKLQEEDTKAAVQAKALSESISLSSVDLAWGCADLALAINEEKKYE